ncbi:MAG: hypothetical protein LBV43_14845 [Prevotella sp.]|jgi:hypothetical protein|nr:hypothetical protein [Prevotella sp.]
MLDTNVLNKQLQEAIRSKLPKGTNVASVLSDILSIGKEAVYRRLRGDVQFTLDEAALIAKKMGISLDYIINSPETENLFFEYKSQRYYNLREIDYEMAEEYLGVLKLAAQSSYSEQVFTSNVFPQYPMHFSFLLAKYTSFRWAYLNQDMTSMVPFHEMEFTESFYKLNKAILDETMNMESTCYIWDNSMFQSVVKEIDYFRSIRLINSEDIDALKNELLWLLDILENIAAKGRFDTGKKIQVYISNISSDASYFYLDADTIHLSMIGVFSLNYVVSLETKTLQKVKERINSLKRVSTLISESGEVQRTQFFKTQRELISSL